MASPKVRYARPIRLDFRAVLKLSQNIKLSLSEEQTRRTAKIKAKVHQGLDSVLTEQFVEQFNKILVVQKRIFIFRTQVLTGSAHHSVYSSAYSSADHSTDNSDHHTHHSVDHFIEIARCFATMRVTVADQTDKLTLSTHPQPTPLSTILYNDQSKWTQATNELRRATF